MTKVVRGQATIQDSINGMQHRATASIASESTATTLAGRLTPRSDSNASFSFEPAPANTSQFQRRSEDVVLAGPSADGAIPSDDDSYSTNNVVHSSTPSGSATPLSSTTRLSQNASRIANSSVIRLERSGNEGIEARLENLRMSSPESSLGMSDIAAAIEGVASSSGSQASLLEPGSPGRVGESSSRPFSRRRSSLQTNSSPHDVRDEEPPQERFHEPAFQQAFGNAKILMSELADVLGSSSLHMDPNSTVHRLHRATRDLAQFRCPASRTVGFVGESGVGKSSLINSLLDLRGLARTSNSGAACTCAVTEYHYHESDNFAVDTELFSMNDIMEQVTELLHSYRHFHLHGAGMENDEKKDFEDRAQIAKDTFQAMFRGQLESEQFLTEEPEDSVLSTLRSWTQDMLPSAIGGKKVRSSLADCSALLMRLTSEQTSAQDPAVWPYVRKIKVFLKAHILSKGLVLVDLPGLRDLNSARRNITERYLLHCDEIFAICHIGRATTDAGVTSVFELARRANLSNVGIICTKSDDIRAEEAKKDWKGRRAQTIQQLINAESNHRKDLQNIESELAEYDDVGDDDWTEEDKNLMLQLNQRARKGRNQIDDRVFELKQYLITTRNASVMEKLNDLYRNKVLDGRLIVFCVSNTDYWEKRDRSKDNALPLLQLSGIIAIRRHCISMVANSQLRTAKKYIQHDCPAILSDIKLWVQSGAESVSAERKQVVRETLSVLEARLRREFNGSHSQVNSIARSINQEFQTQLYERRRIHDWRQAAGNASREWSGWHHSTYAAFCRKYGDHYTGAAGRHNWNEEAIERMVKDLTTPWQSLCSTIEILFENALDSIKHLMDWAVQYLDAELQDFSDSTVTLNQALTSRQHLLIADVREVCGKFDASLSTLRTDALSGIRSSLIGQAMEASYRACNCESGGGSDSRRKAIINGTLWHESLFENLMKRFRNTFNDLAHDLQIDMAFAVQTHLDVIHGTLDIVRSENVATESEQNPESRGRVGAEIERAKTDIRRIQAVAEP